MRVMICTAGLLAVTCAACGGAAGEATADVNPPPYAGVAELQPGQFHTFGDGHRVTVHTVAHRQRTVLDGKELMGLATEVEVCAGTTGYESAPTASWILFSEIPFEMQGTVGIVHSGAAPMKVGLKAPSLLQKMSQELAPGECVRGWLDFLNIYGDYGEPTKLGFQQEGKQYNVEVVWPSGTG